jgi:type I restriction enzyme M protein
MSEQLIQNDLIQNPPKIGKWNYYSIGATTVKQLKENKIIRNVDYGKEEKKKPDALIVLNKNVIALIENKTPTEFNTKKKKRIAIDQEMVVAKKLKTKILIATDTKESIWINVLTGKVIKDEKGNDIKTIFDPKNEKISLLIEKVLNSINENNDKIKPKNLVNPTDLAKQIWQDVWSVSGATPENCLYTFVELFIFKYLSDLDVLKGIYSFNNLIEMYEKNTKDEVLENYADSVRPKIKSLFPENILDKTTIINGSIFVSKDQKAVKGYSSVFKKILFKFKNYGKLEYIDYDFKSQLFESFLKESISKKKWGQFFTPLKVVRAIVEMAKDEIKEGISICDPACGVGKFLLEPIKAKIEQFYKIDKVGITSKITLHGFDKGFDKDEQKTIIMAKANMLIYFSDLIKENSGITKDFAKIFNDSFILKTNSILGTLSDPVINKYDLILTNPPYAVSGSSNLKEEIKKDGELVKYYKINGIGVEGLFIEWIINALKPGGKAFIVIPDGILNRLHDKNIRKFILDECFIDGIISLPLNTFFTTNKKTYILCITKKQNIAEVQTEPVFTYLVSEIGETRDINRFDIDQNDLQEAVMMFSYFKGNKNKFYLINKDSRCKIIKYSEFEDTKNWIIDDYWSEKERIDLGLIEKDKIFDISEFSNLIGDISNNLIDLQNELDELELKKKEKIKFKTFKITQLFEAKLGIPKYTRKYGNDNKGDYPVYSASNETPLTHISTYDYNGSYLTWARNGFAGYIKITNGKFSINYDRGILVPKNKKINVEYVKFVLEPILRKTTIGRKDISGKNEFTKVYLSTIEEQEIPVPINEKGDISEDFQLEIVNEYKFIWELKKELTMVISNLKNIKIKIDDDKEYKLFPISKYFNIEKGNSKYTNKYIKSNSGEYSVYSSKTTNDGILGKINTYDFDTYCLTWTTDGIHAGTVFNRNGKFSMTTHCGALILKKEYCELIDLSYIYHYLKNNLKKLALGEQNKRVTVNCIIDMKLPIPFKYNKEDILKQKEISQKYDIIENIKERAINQINQIIGIDTIINKNN